MRATGTGSSNTPAGDAPSPGRVPARGTLRRFLSIIVLAAAIVALIVTFGRQLAPTTVLSHYDALRSTVEARPLSSMLGYMAAYAALTAFSIPGALLMTVVGGLLFGWLAGGAAAALASTAGGSVLFLVSRTTLGRYLSSHAGPRLHGALTGLREDAVNYLLFLRLVPLFPFWLVNIAAGVVGMRFQHFLAATLVGTVPATLAFSSAGAALDGMVLAQKASYDACRAAGEAACTFDVRLSTLLTPGIAGSLVALGLLALLPVVVKRWRSGPGRPVPSADKRP